MINTPLSGIFPLHGLTDFENDYEDNNELKQSMILFGRDASIQTAMLFQACLSLVSSKRDAIFITKFQFKEIPLMIYKYLQKIEEIIGYLSQIHLEVNKPSIIVIDGLHNYILEDTDITDKNYKLTLIGIHLKNAIEYIQLKNNLCMGLISSSQIMDTNFLKMYFDIVCHLEQEKNDFLYKLLVKTHKNEAIMKLSINKPYIKLEDITLE